MGNIITKSRTQFKGVAEEITQIKRIPYSQGPNKNLLVWRGGGGGEMAHALPLCKMHYTEVSDKNACY